MSAVKLTSEPRDKFGKGAARQMRRDGRVPAVVYGGDADVQHVSLDSHDLMMALKVPKVVLEVEIGDGSIFTAPRDVQRDPIRPIIEHIDLVVLSQREVRERLVVGQAMVKAEAAALEAELEPVAVSELVAQYLDEGMDPDPAIEKAIADIQEQQKAQAEAAAAAAAAEDAAAAEAVEGGEGAAEEPAAAAAEGGEEAAGE